MSSRWQACLGQVGTLVRRTGPRHRRGPYSLRCGGAVRPGRSRAQLPTWQSAGASTPSVMVRGPWAGTEEGRVEDRHTAGAVEGGVDVAVAGVHERHACRIRPRDAVTGRDVDKLTLSDVDDGWARVGVPRELRAGLDGDPGDHRPGEVAHVDHVGAVSFELDPELPNSGVRQDGRRASTGTRSTRPPKCWGNREGQGSCSFEGSEVGLTGHLEVGNNVRVRIRSAPKQEARRAHGQSPGRWCVRSQWLLEARRAWGRSRGAFSRTSRQM
jgi:hypothetical protein